MEIELYGRTCPYGSIVMYSDERDVYNRLSFAIHAVFPNDTATINLVDGVAVDVGEEWEQIPSGDAATISGLFVTHHHGTYLDNMRSKVVVKFPPKVMDENDAAEHVGSKVYESRFKAFGIIAEHGGEFWFIEMESGHARPVEACYPTYTLVDEILWIVS